MSMIRFFCILIGFFSLNQSYAEPPFDVIQACINGETSNSSLSITQVEETGFTKSPSQCETKYKLNLSGHEFGTFACNGHEFLLVGEQKISLNKAINRSLNSQIKPGHLHPALSSWSRIDANEDSYLCVESPLSTSGIGAANTQYYLVEHAFDASLKPVAYYYFFNMDLKPLIRD